MFVNTRLIMEHSWHLSLSWLLGSQGQSSKQTALIGGVAAAGGVALVALVAFTLLFVKYRIARLFMNRNKIEDIYSKQEENVRKRNEFVQEEDFGATNDIM